MSDEPRIGDKVLITHEATVTGPNWVTLAVDGASSIPITGGQVEILERADNPANDRVGTVRRHPIVGHVYVKTASYLYPWTTIDRNPGRHLDNRLMVGSPVIGVVPGSPADRD